MWIVMYIAMMASLRAMGLAPGFVPVRTDEDRPPFGEISRRSRFQSRRLAAIA